jgi:putative spermidine/putrescine transport system permease protein
MATENEKLTAGIGFGGKRRPAKSPLDIPVLPLLIPAALITSLVFVMPLLVFLRFSFNRYVPQKVMETAFTLENYRLFFSNPYYLEILWRTITTAFFATLFTLVISFPVAYYMAHANARIRSFMVILLVLPMMIGGVIRGMGWIGLLTERGLLNRIFLSLGLITEPLQMLYHNQAVIFVATTIEIPMMTITIEATMETIHPDVELAAQNLGADKFNTLWRINIPLAIPGILAGTLLVFVQCMNTYTTSRMIGGPRLPMMAPALYGELTDSMNWPFSAAIAVILMILTLGITFAYSSILEKRYLKSAHITEKAQNHGTL